MSGIMILRGYEACINIKTWTFNIKIKTAL